MWMQTASFLSLAIVGAQSQYLPPGTTDVPTARTGDCSGGPATYVYRMSSKKPNDFFPDICKNMGGAEIHFNDPCAWAHGQAQLTTAHFTKSCKGATRMIHWHNQADEWGFVSKGRLMTFVASPDGLPWPSSTNVLSRRGVWYFPSGWLHGLMCLTDEADGGCEFTIVFASPQAAEPNGHNLDTTLSQAPGAVAAAVLDVDMDRYMKMRLDFGRAEVAGPATSPIVTMVAPGACEPHCPPVQETGTGAPAAMEAAAVEETMYLSGAEGVVLHQIRTKNFPFARTMSQERTQLSPGAVRPILWASADAVLVVIDGSVTVSLEGGILGSEAHLAYRNETLVAGDIAYFPNGRAYWFFEATGKAVAETITVFNVGNWKSFELSQSLRQMPEMVVLSNLHQKHSSMSGFESPIHI